jgi:hypothetical protein
MSNHYTNIPPTYEELMKWNMNKNINPRTNKTIKTNGKVYKYLESIWLRDKIKIELLNCIDDRDPISMNIFWEEKDNKKQIIYNDDLANLIFYTDPKNKIRCFEKSSLEYLKLYNIRTHPITGDEIPTNIFDKINAINISDNNKSIDNLALETFQKFSKISIFIDHLWFLELNKTKLFKLNYELKDFWNQNFSEEQRNNIHNQIIFIKNESDMENDDLEDIQKYLLNQISILLDCEKEEYKYMINYIILGGLGLVIPEIKDLYPDFCLF